MTIQRYSKRHDSSVYYFFEDFAAANYDSRIWYGRGSGGSLAITSPSLLRVRATANSAYELYQNDITDLSAAAFATMNIRAKLSSNTLGRFTLGLEGGASVSDSSWIAFAVDHNYDAGAHWWIETAHATVVTATDTGIAADANTHEFRIETSSTAVKFFLDGVLVGTNTTNITTNLLQPAVRPTSYSAIRDISVDCIELTGQREA